MSTVESLFVTTEQLLAMPENGTDRELWNGELKERPVTVRNRFHTYVVAEVTAILKEWLKPHLSRSGEIHAGEVGTVLKRNPDTTVGIDVAYFSRDVMEQQNQETTLIEGVPRLAVEVLSPSDQQKDIHAKVELYLSVGVDLVWLIDPCFQTVQVHRSGVAPETFNREQRVSGEDVLPELEFEVAQLFPSSNTQSRRNI